MATITSEATTNQCPNNINTFLNTYLLSSKTLRGSLFPLLPLRMRRQNHERVPISPISLIGGNHGQPRCCNKQETVRGPLFPLLALRVMCQNHERVPISSISPILRAHALTRSSDVSKQIGELTYHNSKRDLPPVKAPAVKPCIVYITLLPCSVGSKELSAYRLLFAPIGYTISLADLVKYRLSAVALLLCYGDPNWPSSRRPRVRSIDTCRAKHSRGQPRADGWWNNKSTRCCVFHFHTKQHGPNL